MGRDGVTDASVAILPTLNEEAIQQRHLPAVDKAHGSCCADQIVKRDGSLTRVCESYMFFLSHRPFCNQTNPELETGTGRLALTVQMVHSATPWDKSGQEGAPEISPLWR